MTFRCGQYKLIAHLLFCGLFSATRRKLGQTVVGATGIEPVPPAV